MTGSTYYCRITKTARIFFLLVACIFPILVGGLHTATHFKELLTPEIYEYLQKKVPLLEEEQTLWNIWRVVSFMMGICFIVIGLINISILRLVPKTKSLPLLPIIAMILYQISVVYVGYTYEGDFQYYGGVFGIILLFTCLIMTIKIKNYDS